ncbi:MAG: hypothetical protein ACTHO8_02435 [Solirubrobacterales bacterium]
MSNEELRSWFEDPQSPKRLLLGLRALGFSSEAIAEVTGAASRDTVYAWGAGRSFPSRWNAEQLDRLRVVVSWICKEAHFGPESVWLVLNGWPGGLDPTGPTALELLANRESTQEWLLVTNALGMSVGKAPPQVAPPAADPEPQPALRSSEVKTAST